MAEPVAYIVTDGTFDEAALRDFVRFHLPVETQSLSFVTVRALPPALDVADFDAVGAAVLDDELVNAWQRTIDSSFGPDRLQVGIATARGAQGMIQVVDEAPALEPSRSGETCRDEEGGPSGPGNGVPAAAFSYIDGGPTDEHVPQTMVDLLLCAADHCGDHAIIHVDAELAEQSQTYRDLVADACRVAQGLSFLGLTPGATVLLQLDSSHQFFTGLWGCLLGGYVPALAAVPADYADGIPGCRKVEAAWRALHRPPILTVASHQSALREFADARGWGALRTACLEDLLANEPMQPYGAGSPDDVAVMFLTSGSTGMPKIVVQQHRALITQVLGSARRLSLGERDVVLNWMPLDHVGSVVMLHSLSLHAGCSQVHVPTHYVLGDPLRWLDLLNRYQVSVSWAPNFAFGLVTDRLDRLGEDGYRWDLSCVRAILNGGEAISARCARRFLRMLEPAGLPASAMWPVWGMAETSSAVVHSERFSATTSSDNDSFVEVGRPIAGIRLRVVDENNSILPEGKIGRLHVQGAMVTAGYYENAEANAEVFTTDGWFNTGDLGLLKNGCLTLTGRAKDVIIVNGANYASHEIESVVEELPFIDRSYTAACAVRQEGADTDQIAVFFHLLPGIEEREALRRVRSKILREVGVNPDHLVPVGRADIPKTGLGKIQRSRFSEQYGRRLLGYSESAAGTERTTELPAWFYRPVWSPSVARRLPGQESGPVLVFLDSLGLGDELCGLLRGRGQSCVSVRQDTGAAFRRVANDAFVIDPGNAEHYLLLVRAITDKRACPDHILHLSDYAAHVQFPNTQTIRTSCRAGTGWLIHLLTAMEAAAWDSPVSLRVVGACTQRVGETDRVTFTRAPLRNLLKTAAQEIPWLRCHHLDLEIGERDGNAQRIVDEIDGDTADPDTAYRAGHRLVPRLVPVHRAEETVRVRQFASGGLYVLVGGLGGIGVEIARHLLIHYGAKVLLLGRSRVHGSDTGANVALKELRTLSADVRYAVADVTDEYRVRECIDQAEEHWKTKVAGVVHLASHYTEQSLLACSADQLLAAMEPKICGAWNLHKVLEDRPETPLILFSSATGYFGAVMQGPYAAANAALDAFADHLHTEAVQAGASSCCRSIGWSVWHETGISQGIALTGQAPRRGYQIMTSHQALTSLSVAAAGPQPFVLVGLDPDGRTTGRYMAGPPLPTRKIVARIDELNGVDQIVRVLAPIRLLDRYGTPTSCEVMEGVQTPEGATEPQSDIERRIASVWRDVLGQRKIQRNDDFFELGGTSLQMAQMHQLICQELARDLRWADVLRTRTISAIAALLDSPNAGTADTLTWQGIKYTYRYLKHRPAPQPVPLVLISGAFQGMYAMPRIEHLLRPLGDMILADLPGSGSADDLSSDYGFDFLADCLSHLLDELDVSRVNLLGVSYGGSIAYEFAHRWPHRINRLALVGAATSFPADISARRADSTWILEQGRLDRFADHIVEATMCLNPDIVIRNRETTRILMEKILRESTPWEAARYLDVQNRVLAPARNPQDGVFDRPTLVFTGEHDVLTPPSFVRDLAATIPGAIFTSFKDADHLVPMERPEEMTDLLIRFFTDQCLDDLPYCYPIEIPQARQRHHGRSGTCELPLASGRTAST
ncbi:MAG TPA: alpha/beta fold hydrolase [Pseudonocardiaceae bacterium]|nr:alpha/beta fold hydrolase [Pseudonocardiaceae bacterium]